MHTLILSSLAVVGLCLASPDSASAAEQLRFEDGQGQTVLVIKANHPTYRLFDGKHKLIARYQSKANRLEITDAQGLMLAQLSGNAQKLKIRIAKRTAYSIKAQVKGGFKVKDGDEKLLYHVKPNGDGFTINDENGADLGHVRNTERRIQLTKADDSTVYTSQSQVPKIAAASLLYAKLPLSLRVGLLLQLRTQ
jgi:hypothetical protein